MRLGSGERSGNQRLLIRLIIDSSNDKEVAGDRAGLAGLAE